MIHDMFHAANITPDQLAELIKKLLYIYRILQMNLMEMMRRKKMKIKKRWILHVLTVALCTLFMMPTTAFARGGEEAPKATVTEEKPK